MDPMEEIWKDTALPDKTGKQTIVLKGINDLAFLYVSGFVDVEKYNFQSWIDAYAPSKQKDGTYIVTHDQWIEKRKFRYEGPVGTPFDPSTLEEKEYSEDEILELLNKKIIPNTIFNRDSGPQMIANLKLYKKIQNGKIKIDKEFKKGLKTTLDTYPSPLRILQIRVQALRQAKDGQVVQTQLAAEKSSFAAGQTAEKIAAARLDEIIKLTQKESQSVPSDAPVISLKDLKKKKKPHSGRV